MSTASIAARVAARKAAEAALELISESVEGDAEHFWRVVRDKAIEHSPLLATMAKLVPMTDTEAETFSDTRMPFGKYAGHYIHTIQLSYLDWLIGQPDEFKAQLKRYLANDSVKEILAQTVHHDLFDDG